MKINNNNNKTKQDKNHLRFTNYCKRKITPCDRSILTAVRLFDIEPASWS